MKLTRFLPHLLMAVAISVGACAQLGVKAPSTFPEAAAAAQVSVTALRQTAIDNLMTGFINVDQAKQARAAADKGNEAIDLAVSVYVAACPQPPQPASGPPAPKVVCVVPSATSQLDTAIAALKTAQSVLAAAAAKKGK